jgi:hypothetical protein
MDAQSGKTRRCLRNVRPIAGDNAVKAVIVVGGILVFVGGKLT